MRALTDEIEKIIGMEKDRNSLWKAVLQYSVVAICAGSLGFGSSQMAIAGGLRLEMHAIQVSQAQAIVRLDLLEKSLGSEVEARKVGDQERDKAHDRMSSRLDKLIEQNTELIALLRTRTAGQP